MTLGKSRYFIAGIIPYIIWGTMSVPLRDIKHYPAQEILYYRIFASVAMVWLTILLCRRKALVNDFKVVRNAGKKEQIRLFLLTCLAAILITGNWFTYIYAVNSISLKSAAFAYMVCPLITALCGFMILKEPLTKAKVLAIAIAVISIGLLAKGSFVEMLWAIIIASCYALYLIILKVIRQVDKFNFLGVQLILSALIILPVYSQHSAVFPLSTVFWVHIFLIATVFTIIPLFLNAYALREMPSSSLGILIYLNPIVAFCLAFFYFDERINTAQLVAYTLLLLSVLVFNGSLIRSVVYKKSR